MALLTTVMFVGTTNADEYLFSVSGIFDPGVDDNAPFTAPGGIVNYSFILGEPQDFEPDGDFVLWYDVAVNYSLNGAQDDYIVSSLFLTNPPSSGGDANIFLLNVGPDQLNLNLPSVDLYELLEGEVFIQPGSIDFDGGFFGNGNQFRGNLTISSTTVPEPSSAMLLLGTAATTLIRRRPS